MYHSLTHMLLMITVIMITHIIAIAHTRSAMQLVLNTRGSRVSLRKLLFKGRSAGNSKQHTRLRTASRAQTGEQQQQQEVARRGLAKLVKRPVNTLLNS